MSWVEASSFLPSRSISRIVVWKIPLWRLRCIRRPDFLDGFRAGVGSACSVDATKRTTPMQRKERFITAPRSGNEGRCLFTVPILLAGATEPTPGSALARRTGNAATAVVRVSCWTGCDSVQKCLDAEQRIVQAVPFFHECRAVVRPGRRRCVFQDSTSRLRESGNLKEGFEESVHAGLDELAHGGGVRRQHHAAGGQRIQQRPGNHKRNAPIDVQVASPQHLWQVLAVRYALENENATSRSRLDSEPIA